MASERGGYKAGKQVSTHRNSASTNGTRPEGNASREYGTLALEGLAGDTTATWYLRSGDKPEDMDTMDIMDMETGDLDRQRVILVCGQTEEEGEEPPG